MLTIEQLIQNIKTSSSFSDCYAFVVSNGRNKHIFEYYQDDILIQTSYEEYDRLVKGTAHKLREKVGSKDKYIALRLPNSPEFCILFWAILAAGYDLLLLNYLHDLDSAIELMAQAGTETLITDQLSEEISYLPPASLIEEASDFPLNSVWGDRIALCTSGTTGDARVFVHDSAGILSMVEGLVLLSKRLIVGCGSDLLRSVCLFYLLIMSLD